jgi:hypothetical protein
MSVVYHAHGLTIASDYDLPMPLASCADHPDMVVVRADERVVPEDDRPGGTPLALADTPDGRVFYSFAQRGREVELRFPGLCLMRTDETVHRVSVHLHPGVDESLVPVLIAGSLVSLHLIMRGELALHASSVEVAGSALAFTGMAGMGKSTIATLFGRAGHPLVTDDVLRVDFRAPDEVWVHRGGRESRLRSSAAELAAGTIARSTSDGRTAVDLPLAADATLPLGVCLIPQPSRTATRVSVQRLSPAAGLTALLRFPRLVGWREPRRLAEQFSLVADLASTIPVLVAALPWGPPFDPTLPEQLLTELRDVGVPV